MKIKCSKICLHLKRLKTNTWHSICHIGKVAKKRSNGISLPANIIIHSLTNRLLAQAAHLTQTLMLW